MMQQLVEVKPVVIVGGSLVGLSAANFLRSWNVPTIVVEKHVKSMTHPRAIGFTPRTLELYRAIGLDTLIPQVSPNLRLKRSRVESLAGKHFETTQFTPGGNDNNILDFSPCTGSAIAQDKLEHILRENAKNTGAELLLGFELTGFKENPNGIVVTVRDSDGNIKEFEASYLIACDGNKSTVRQALEIDRHGYGLLSIQRSVLFRAPLDDYLKQMDTRQFVIDQPDLKAFLTTYEDGRWVLMFGDDEARSDEDLKQLIIKAIGRPDLADNIEIITTGRWELSALISSKYLKGRVFLAGDAAHTLPPNRGGYGANTGIEDVHNLSWKLAHVLQGVSKPDLLQTYEDERLPIGWLRYNQIFVRPDYKSHLEKIGGTPPTVPLFHEIAVELGQRLQSSAVVFNEGEETLPPAKLPSEWQGQPGTRLNHLWITNADGEKKSTLDLVRNQWILITSSNEWKSVSERVSKETKINLNCFQLGKDFKYENGDQDFLMKFGINNKGVSLVRPDGYIAWKCTSFPKNAEQELLQVLCQVASISS